MRWWSTFVPKFYSAFFATFLKPASIAGFILLLFFYSPAYAAILTDDFDSLSTGALQGQNGWFNCTSGFNLGLVVDTQFRTASNSFEFPTGGRNYCKSLASSPTAIMQLRASLYIPSGLSNSITVPVLFGISKPDFNGTSAVGVGIWTTSGTPHLLLYSPYNSSYFFGSSTIVGADTWRDILVDMRDSRIRVFIDGNLEIDTSYTDFGISDLSGYDSATLAVTSSWGAFYLDDLLLYSDTDAPPLPADYSLPLDPADFSTTTSWFDHDANSSEMTRYDGTVFYGNDANINYCTAYTAGLGCYDGHHGIDFGTYTEGKDVLAAASGTVATLGWQNPSNHSQGYGYYMRMYHAQFDQSTIYAHATTTASFFSVNDPVARGDTILLSGTTGQSTAQHLHFSVIDGNTADPNEAIDPYGWTATSTDPRTNNKGYLWKTNPPSL
jgi:murein DD-endopeptidase MepM/ murein hydrolase activator NlpD